MIRGAKQKNAVPSGTFAHAGIALVAYGLPALAAVVQVIRAKEFPTLVALDAVLDARLPVALVAWVLVVGAQVGFVADGAFLSAVDACCSRTTVFCTRFW